MQIERFKDPQTEEEQMLVYLNYALNSYWDFIRKGYKVLGLSREIDWIDVTKAGDEFRNRVPGKSGRIIMDFSLEDEECK